MGDDKSEKNGHNGDTKGLQFAITLLAAFGSIAYTTYAYFQANPVSDLNYTLVAIVFPALLILPMGLIFYVIIKGYMIEYNHEDSKKLREFVSGYYKSLFLMSSLVLLFVLLASLVPLFTLLALLVPLSLALYIDNSLILIAIFLIVSIGTCIIYFKYHPMKYIIGFITNSNKFIINQRFWKVAILLFIGLSFWLALWPSTTHILQGHITIDMESVYYKSDEQIPVLIHVTGPYTGLSVKLSNISKHNNLNQIAFIEKLEPHSNQKIKRNKSLIGDTLSSGEYIVFINTTNLSTGYYKLECMRTKYGLSDAKSFYLSNNKSHISRAAVAMPSSNM